jgi:hypothetical protein
MVALRLPWNDNVEERKPQKNHPCGWLLLVGLFGCPTLFYKKSFVLSALVRRFAAQRHTPVCLSLDSELPFSGVLMPQRKPQKKPPLRVALIGGR